MDYSKTFASISALDEYTGQWRKKIDASPAAPGLKAAVLEFINKGYRNARAKLGA